MRANVAGSCLSLIFSAAACLAQDAPLCTQPLFPRLMPGEARCTALGLLHQSESFR